MTRKELVELIYAKQSFLCVGLDTDIKKIPQHLLKEEDPIFAFNKAIIDATSQYCMAYKPNLAFYESNGVKGWISFEKTIQYLNKHYPHHFIIADAKRGDIGNTSAMYARTFFEEMNLDSLTVAPYMGEDSVSPFLQYEGKWVILLALTSNKGSQDFQLTSDAEGERLFEKVCDMPLSDPIYQNTRRMILSEANPYYFEGKEIVLENGTRVTPRGIGSPHTGYDMIWHMSIIMRGLTTDNKEEMEECLQMLKATTGGMGLMHESFQKDDPKEFTRAWFSWANGLFGELVMKLYDD